LATNQIYGIMMGKVIEINEKDIEKYYDFLGHKGNGITEIRLIKPRWNENKVLPPSYFIKSVEELIEICKRFNGEWNVYTGINYRDCEGKNDIDVKFISNIGHDIDAHNNGDEGMLIAGQVALKMLEDFKTLGYQEPLIVNSGYGYWVIHHISPIENTEENVKKIKEFGKKIKEKYQVEKIEIDSSVYNPSRIGRVAGTLNLRTKDKPVLSSVVNNPLGTEDLILKNNIIEMELQTYKTSITNSQSTPSINSFMDYCLTHGIPKGDRHRVISRHVALYISDHPDRELLRQQYIKIQKGNDEELDGWLKNIDLNGKDKYPFSIGQLINFTKKYKIPFDWKAMPEYQQWQKEKKAERNLDKEIKKEEMAERLNKAIKFFTDKKHLAQQFLQVQPLYYDKNKLWWLWIEENKCWEMCDETDIMNCISKHSEANTISSTDKNEILEALKQESRKLKPLEPEKSWIQFKDKFIDIYTNEIIDSTPKHFATNPIDWKIGDSEDTPIMDKIFEEWVGKDHVKTLYEILAYCILSDYPIHRIFCFIGSGLNGKSKYLDLIKIFIGGKNCCSTELDNLLTSRFEVARLHKKLICLMGETNFGEISKTSMLKKLSGGDLIGFEYKNKNPFEDKNYAKIIISTNNLPATTDKTIGFYRRWMIIDFPNTFSEKKDILLDIPNVEYENLALKCCKIIKELLEKREFYLEGTIEERMEKYESKSNFLEKFIKEHTEESYDGYITVSDFSKKFWAWSKEHRHREMSETTMGMTMKKLGYEQGRKNFEWMYDGKGGQARVWLGIKWK
jgi:P4 family phage/plasmid primase-like protien